MSDFLNHALFGIYPYVCLAVFLLGSLVRFDREQYTWKSDSSQLLRRGQLRWGSNLFHVGILLLFFGHLFGLLTPHSAYAALGLTPGAKQMLAMTSGGVLGAMILAGVLILLHRRLTIARIRGTSTRMDILILLWILATVSLGLVSIFFSAQHLDGSTMLLLADWAQHIVTFRGGAAAFLAGVPIIFKIHLFFGMTLFLLFPFSRLVHVWSGFASVAYLGRAYQIVRNRG
jgi:nitrate reductase gamma subunit